MKIKTSLALSSAIGGMTLAEQATGRYMRAPDGHEPDKKDDYDAAFAAAVADEPPVATPDTSKPADAAPAAGEQAAEPAPGAGDPAPAADGAGDAAGGDPTPAPAAPASDGDAASQGAAPDDKSGAAGEPAASAQDIVAQLAEALKQNAQPAAQPATQPAAQPAAEEPPLYNDQELAVIADYEKNWPDVAAAEALKRRAEYADLISFVFKAVAEHFNPKLEQITVLSNLAHEQQLRAAVPDYTPDLETQVAQWVDTQPPYLQAAMKQVMQSGTSEEVADLIGRYRAATGVQPAQSAAPAAPAPKAPPAAPKTELSSAAMQAAESLAPVSGERSAVPQGEDPGDFDSAFQKYAATGAV